MQVLESLEGYPGVSVKSLLDAHPGLLTLLLPNVSPQRPDFRGSSWFVGGKYVEARCGTIASIIPTERTYDEFPKQTRVSAASDRQRSQSCPALWTRGLRPC